MAIGCQLTLLGTMPFKCIISKAAFVYMVLPDTNTISAANHSNACLVSLVASDETDIKRWT
jgi:hypothetical protein